MILTLPLLLVAIVLAIVGVAQGSGPVLVGSIVASLLTAVTLAVSARHSAAARLAVGRDGLVVPLLPPPRRQTTIPAQLGPDDRDDERLQSGAAAHSGGGADDTQTLPAQGAQPVAQPADTDEDPPDEPPVQAVTPEHAAVVAGLSVEVVVVDERPRYHLATCAYLIDREVLVLPVREAIEFGFTPCARCAPDTELLAQARRSG